MRLLLLAAALLPLACASSPTAPPGAESQVLAPGLTLTLVAVPAAGADLSVCKTWYGVDGDTPEEVLSEGWVVRDGRRIALDVSCMAPGFGTELYDVTVEPLAGTDDLLVTGRFSDGAGTAEVEWRVGTERATRTALVSGPDLYERERRRRGM